MTESGQRTVRRTPVTADGIMAAFSAAGLRSTRPRQIIASRLASHAADQTDFATDELWQQLQAIDPQLGRATLFRAVDVLVELGVLDRIELGDGRRRYRVCASGHHHHLVCTRCRRIEEVDICLPEAQLTEAAARAGFDVERHALELYGRCASCRAADG
ncbi:MAG TPA: Fur family transcriptional regulator [Chloroflexota bacterium]|nr:Fur family transcriptional regulator [Chloroflexota bacterium]